MDTERVIVRTISNLSYAGEICINKNISEKGLLIKPSPKSNIKVWIPTDEIQCIIKMNGNVLEREAVLNECKLYEDL
jgi:hypothetical protein